MLLLAFFPVLIVSATTAFIGPNRKGGGKRRKKLKGGNNLKNWRKKVAQLHDDDEQKSSDMPVVRGPRKEFFMCSSKQRSRRCTRIIDATKEALQVSEGEAAAEIIAVGQQLQGSSTASTSTLSAYTALRLKTNLGLTDRQYQTARTMFSEETTNMGLPSVKEVRAAAYEALSPFGIKEWQEVGVKIVSITSIAQVALAQLRAYVAENNAVIYRGSKTLTFLISWDGLSCSHMTRQPQSFTVAHIRLCKFGEKVPERAQSPINTWPIVVAESAEHKCKVQVMKLVQKFEKELKTTTLKVKQMYFTSNVALSADLKALPYYYGEQNIQNALNVSGCGKR